MATFQTFDELNDWQQLPNGEYIRQAIEQSLSSWGPRIFGYHLVKLGALAANLTLSGSMISHQTSLSNYELDNINLLGSLEQLPLQNDAVDCVIANFLLEFHPNPYLVLREIDRVLISGGYLILTGFNPLSTCFLGKIIPKYQKQIPWCGHFYLPSRVKDWLALLGYKLMEDQRLIHHPLIGSISKRIGCQQLLASWLPGSGSIYVLVAKKLDSPLTPIREKQKSKARNWSPVASAGKICHKSYSKHCSK